MAALAFWGTPLELLGMLGRELVRVLRGKPTPAPPQRCSNCGYTKGPNTVLIPNDRCPSCGAYSFGKGS